MKSLFNFLRGGDDAIIASSQPLTRTSSSLPTFLLGTGIYNPEVEYGVAAGIYGVMLEGMPNLELLKSTGSVRTGALWFDLKSIFSRSIKLCFGLISDS